MRCLIASKHCRFGERWDSNNNESSETPHSHVDKIDFYHVESISLPTLHATHTQCLPCCFFPRRPIFTVGWVRFYPGCRFMAPKRDALERKGPFLPYPVCQTGLKNSKLRSKLFETPPICASANTTALIGKTVAHAWLKNALCIKILCIQRLVSLSNYNL